MHDIKVKALAASGDFDAMVEVCNMVRSSSEATSEQQAAAAAARRSIVSAAKAESAMKLQVAMQRYAKLIEML